ncbi:hypothetical protein CHELA1G11_10723 [Hyphomicrobiales bacterium]|nr:hypothetical protein CHELA1G11_10723 [Hyphomicrobiales bacterium]
MIVLALAGDSTTTTFMNKSPWQRQDFETRPGRDWTAMGPKWVKQSYKSNSAETRQIKKTAKRLAERTPSPLTNTCGIPLAYLSSGVAVAQCGHALHIHTAMECSSPC